MLANALSNNGYQINPDDYVFEDHIEKVIKPSDYQQRQLASSGHGGN